MYDSPVYLPTAKHLDVNVELGGEGHDARVTELIIGDRTCKQRLLRVAAVNVEDTFAIELEVSVKTEITIEIAVSFFECQRWRNGSHEGDTPFTIVFDRSRERYLQEAVSFAGAIVVRSIIPVYENIESIVPDTGLEVLIRACS